MFMRVAAIVFLFLILFRFQQSKSVSQIIISRYNDTTIKRLQKFELYLEFLVRYRYNNVIPRFLNLFSQQVSKIFPYLYTMSINVTIRKN